MSNRLLMALLLGLSFLLVVIAAAIFIIWRQGNRRNQDLILITKKPVKTRFFHSLYRFLNEWMLTKQYMGRIRRRFELLEPGDNKQIEKDAMKTLGKVWGVSLFVSAAAFCMHPSFYMVFSSITLVYIMNSYTLFRTVDNREIKFLKELQQAIVEIRHFYYEYDMVDRAIWETMAETHGEITIHLKLIYDVLNSSDLEEAVDEFNDTAPNRFIKMFLSCCINVLKFGDHAVDGTPLFLRNLTMLNEEIDIEVRKRQRMNHKLSGLVVTAVAPMFTLDFIKLWAVDNLQELERYYNGPYGILATVVICMISLVIYSILNNMREMELAENGSHPILDFCLDVPLIHATVQRLKQRNYGKAMRANQILRRMGEQITVEQLYIKKILAGAAAVVFGFLLSAVVHSSMETIIFTDLTAVENQLVTIPNDSMVEEIQNSILELSQAYKDEKPTKERIMKRLEKEGRIVNPVFQETVADEVLDRVRQHQKNYFQWWELLCIAGLAILSYQMPWYMILYRKRLLEMAQENEVIQFQAIILMLMYIDRISTREILEEMESFSMIFRLSIAECLDAFAMGEQEALLSMKEKEEYQAFRKIVDNLMMADRIGIRAAFSEVEADRKSFQEKRKQDNEIYIDNKAAMGSFLSFIPISVVIVLYLIVPFVWESLSQLSGFITDMSGMM